MSMITKMENEASVPKNYPTNKKRIQKKFRRRKHQRHAVVLIKGIPHGFYESEMRGYFSQFGTVLRVRVVRSRRTGNSRGYGYIEFEDSEVAQIAAETMNNYLMFDKLLKTIYIPPEEQQHDFFRSSVTAFSYPRERNRLKIMEEKNKFITDEEHNKFLAKTQAKIDEFKKFLEERGIEFNFKISNPGNLQIHEPQENIESDSSVSDVEPPGNMSDRYSDAVLVIDESDEELQFKMPPNVRKVYKRSGNSTAVNPPRAKKLKEADTSSKFPKIKGKLKNWAKNLSADLRPNKQEKETPEGSNGIGKKFKKALKVSKPLLSKPMKAERAEMKKLKKKVKSHLENGASTTKPISVKPKVSKQNKSPKKKDKQQTVVSEKIEKTKTKQKKITKSADEKIIIKKKKENSKKQVPKNVGLELSGSNKNVIPKVKMSKKVVK